MEVPVSRMVLYAMLHSVPDFGKKIPQDQYILRIYFLAPCFSLLLGAASQPPSTGIFTSLQRNAPDEENRKKR